MKYKAVFRFDLPLDIEAESEEEAFDKAVDSYEHQKRFNEGVKAARDWNRATEHAESHNTEYVLRRLRRTACGCHSFLPLANRGVSNVVLSRPGP